MGIDSKADIGVGKALRQLMEVRELMIIIPFLVLVGFLSIASPYFLNFENVFNIFRQFSIIAIIAIGMTMIIITSGIDLSVGSQIALSGIIVANMTTSWNLHPAVAGVLILAFGACVGSINGFFITRFNIAPFIVSLGMLSIAKGTALLISGGLPIRFNSRLSIFGHGYVGPVPMSVIVMFVLAIAGHVFLTRTVSGRNIFAIGNNEKAARLSGIRVERHIFAVYAMTGVLCAISGTLVAGNLRSADPTSGLGYELDVIAACVIGGTSLAGGAGTILGTLLGAALMGVLRNGFVLLGISGFWQIVAIGIVIIAAVLLDSIRERGRRKG